jgi:hypothetical protein
MRSRIKTFADDDPFNLEKKVNKWLEEQGDFHIISHQSSASISTDSSLMSEARLNGAHLTRLYFVTIIYAIA